ncbi:MAG: hypothetical protein AAGN64_02715, partial [Bacteroidota bacterium]
QENKTREIDLSLSKSRRLGDNAFAEYHIRVEVKKSQRPWVVLTKSKGILDREAWSNPSAHSHLPFEPYELAADLRNTSYLNEVGWIGYGVHELGKKPNQPSGWYAAAVGAAKACADAAAVLYWKDDLPHPDQEKRSPTVMEGTGETLLLFTQPVVVLEGNLVRAWIGEDGKIQIEEIEIAPLRLHLRAHGHLQPSFRIDLVTLPALNRYLGHQDSRFDRLCVKSKTLSNFPG